ncbi:15-hydroxyprostaglandin dehydrogenase [Nephila pilipes]|uniref:15-hydroxyprostaglandin dehydrogenase [NAD(+)] n=1 Tax=Nephila pilipes TaxID=299642 RepID=A0A8X6MY88_NEPPI|nr:15-hydroxyprostaglandin dehydrogenase [Nephila pilipes]
MNFAQKIALVTGGAQGIGRAYTNALLNIGMKVCICDITEDPAKEFIENLPSEHKNNVIFQKCDVSSFTDFKNAFEKTISTFGRIDVLINNAGILDEHNFQRVVQVNLLGVIHGTMLAFEYMSINKGGHGGHVINTSSKTGLDPLYIAPVYCATKHAIVGYSRSLGHEYHFEKTGITVNALCPSLVDTHIYQTFPSKCVDAEEATRFGAPLKTLKPEDVANALLKLLADGKNGAILRVDQNGLTYA